MSTITIKEATAASAVGTNLMAGNRLQIVPQARFVSRIGVVGSTNPGDASVDLFYGSTFIGTFFNTTGGANIVPVDAKDMISVSSSMALEPGEPLNVLISDAGATNILAVTLEIVEVAHRAMRRRR